MAVATEISKNKLRKQKKNASADPLGWPKGTVRAVLVLLLTVIFGVCIVIERAIPTDLGLVWGSLVAYYIGHRSNA